MAASGCGAAEGHSKPRLQARGQQRPKVLRFVFLWPYLATRLPFLSLIPPARPQTLGFSSKQSLQYQHSLCSSGYCIITTALGHLTRTPPLHCGIPYSHFFLPRYPNLFAS